MGADEVFGFVFGEAGERDFGVGELVFEEALHGRALVVEEMVAAFVGGVGGAGDDFAFIGAEEGGDVDPGVFKDDFFLFGGVGVPDDDGGFISADIGGGVEFGVVVGEEERVE